MIQRIYIKELFEKLNCRDIRSVKRWCRKNEVAILSDIGSNKKYVIKAEFIAKYMSESLKYVQRKYGKDRLSEFLNSSMNFYSEYRKSIEEKTKEYKPQGEKERSFLSILQKITLTV